MDIYDLRLMIYDFVIDDLRFVNDHLQPDVDSMFNSIVNRQS